MNAHAARTAQLSRIAAMALALMLAIPAAAQQESMRGMSQMPGMQMPAPKPKKRKPKARKKARTSAAHGMQGRE